jgi:hypothetical protein
VPRAGLQASPWFPAAQRPAQTLGSTPPQAVALRCQRRLGALYPAARATQVPLAWAAADTAEWLANIQARRTTGPVLATRRSCRSGAARRTGLSEAVCRSCLAGGHFRDVDMSLNGVLPVALNSKTTATRDWNVGRRRPLPGRPPRGVAHLDRPAGTAGVQTNLHSASVPTSTPPGIPRTLTQPTVPYFESRELHSPQPFTSLPAAYTPIQPQCLPSAHGRVASSPLVPRPPQVHRDGYHIGMIVCFWGKYSPPLLRRITGHSVRCATRRDEKWSRWLV